MIGIPLGIAYSHLIEGAFHQYVLHGLGKRPGSFWGYHWHEHHRLARKHGLVDDGYRTRPLLAWHPQAKEQVQIALGFLLHLPLFPVAPFFVATLGWCGWHFYQNHKRFHLDPEWGRRAMPWHYDHHMGPDQDQNYGITYPFYDYLVGTRVPTEAPSPPKGAETMTPEETVRAMFEAVTAGDRDAFVRSWSEDAVWSNLPVAPIRGRKNIARLWQPLLDHPGSFRAEMVSVAVTGDRVHTERIDRFELFGLRFEAPVAGVFVVRDGAIVENREYWDLLDVARAVARSPLGFLRRLLP